MIDEHSENAVLLGLDGVPWNLLRRWAEAGKLPNFKQLMDGGAAGPLQSTTPPTTPLAWPTIATGTWADKHGIYGFHEISGDYTHEMYTGADLRRPALWDVMTPAVAANVPMTYPASGVDGAMVSGMITPDRDGGFTHPPELSQRIEREIPEYRIELDWYEYADEPDRFLDELAELVEARKQLMHLLAREYDWRLFFFVFTAPDRLQHLHWDEEVILDHYQQLDGLVGDMMRYATDNDANLYVVSDHGFGPISTFVNLNTLLAENGYLDRKRNDGARGTLSKIGVTKSSVLDGLDRLGIGSDALVRYLPKSVVDDVARRIPGDHGLYDVDFTETVAFAHDPNQIYINDTERFDQGIVEPSAVEEVKQDIATELTRAEDPETGERALEIHDGADLFPTDPDAPDLIAVGRGEYEVKTKIADRAFVPADNKAAGHRSEGIFFAWGSNVSPGMAIDDATVADVAPTVLYGAGEPIPSLADGRVLTEIFSASPSTTDSIATERYESDSADESDPNQDGNFDDVEDRLRGLGYLE